MTFARLCEHGEMKAHYGNPWQKYGTCPGGVVLNPEQTIVIEKEDGEWPESAVELLEQYHYPCPPEFQEQVIKWLPTDLLDALAAAQPNQEVP